MGKSTSFRGAIFAAAVSGVFIAGTAFSITGAHAAVQILANSGGPNPTENVLFNNNPADGLSVNGITNLSLTLVTFTGVETLHGDGGQASLGAVDGAFANVSWILNSTTGLYTDLEFAIKFPNADGGPPNTGSITIDVLDQNLAHHILVAGLSSAGLNNFQVHGTLGDSIKQVTLTGDEWSSLELVRIGSAVPELSTWAMMLIGFAGLGFVVYRRQRKNSVVALG